MNTLSDLISRNLFSISFVLQKQSEDSFKLLDKFYFFKVFFELVDSNDCNWGALFFFWRESCGVLIIFAIIHFIESCEELCEFISDVGKGEDKELVFWPYLVESGDKVIGVFGDFIDWSEFFLDVGSNEVLDVLSDELIDLYFFFSGWFVFWHFVDRSKCWQVYYLISEWLVTIVEFSLVNL